MSETFQFPNELWPDQWFQRLTREGLGFANPANPLEIDLGCGDGVFIHQMAAEFPERNYVGVERLLGRIRKVCKRSHAAGLENVRGLRLDTNYAINQLLPLAEAERVHLLFPDPWPKAKHHKRRLACQPEFFRAVHSLLQEGGEFLFKTDHEELFEAAMEAEAWTAHFEKIEWPEEAFFYPITDFEQKWRNEGRNFYRLRLRAIPLS